MERADEQQIIEVREAAVAPPHDMVSLGEPAGANNVDILSLAVTLPDIHLRLLPGNPASTMVTFEVFARAALERLGGEESPVLHMPWARLTRDFRHRPGLTRFLPARL